jgi:hypothetical protein
MIKHVYKIASVAARGLPVVRATKSLSSEVKETRWGTIGKHDAMEMLACVDAVQQCANYKFRSGTNRVGDVLCPIGVHPHQPRTGRISSPLDALCSVHLLPKSLVISNDEVGGTRPYPRCRVAITAVPDTSSIPRQRVLLVRTRSSTTTGLTCVPVTYLNDRMLIHVPDVIPVVDELQPVHALFRSRVWLAITASDAETHASAGEWGRDDGGTVKRGRVGVQGEDLGSSREIFEVVGVRGGCRGAVRVGKRDDRPEGGVE